MTTQTFNRTCLGVALVCLAITLGSLAGRIMYHVEHKINHSAAPQPEQVIVETNPTTTMAPTTTTTTEPAPVYYYTMTAKERDLVERVVMAEAGGEAYVGQLAVAQCILNASELRGIRPAETVRVLKYTKARPEPTESVKRAVAAVFDDGATVFDRDVIYFYAPALVTSTWHETQDYVTTIGCHRFFKEARE